MNLTQKTKLLHYITNIFSSSLSNERGVRQSVFCRSKSTTLRVNCCRRINKNKVLAE